jgi:hypothetical protein
MALLATQTAFASRTSDLLENLQYRAPGTLVSGVLENCQTSELGSCRLVVTQMSERDCTVSRRGQAVRFASGWEPFEGRLKRDFYQSFSTEDLYFNMVEETLGILREHPRAVRVLAPDGSRSQKHEFRFVKVEDNRVYFGTATLGEDSVLDGKFQACVRIP